MPLTKNSDPKPRAVKLIALKTQSVPRTRRVRTDTAALISARRESPAAAEPSAAKAGALRDAGRGNG